MAWTRRNYNNNYNKKKKSKYTQTEKIAFAMGRVKVGLANPDSRIAESYNKGRESTKSTAKKSMF